jgi:hypothetical protein
MNRGNLFSSVEIRYPSREIRREQSGPSPQTENMESEREKTGAKVAHLAIGTTMLDQVNATPTPHKRLR